MLFRKTSTNLCSKLLLIRETTSSLCANMVIALNYGGLLSPVLAESNSSPPIQTFSRIKYLHSNPKLSRAQSAAQRPISLSVDASVNIDAAQAALLDYLHINRELSYQDAHLISKNSPRFLEDLIHKAVHDGEQNVSRALSKFLRYNPINEFEAFFESLGLTPPEYASLLPRGLIYLNDHQLLLDNYHTLANYGIPRIKIGKMYKEVNDICRYEIEVLGMKLRAYEQLGLSKSTVAMIVSSNPRLLVGEADKVFIEVLEKLKELGLDGNWIEGFLSTGNMYDWNKIIDTLPFLRDIGYNDSQIKDLCKEDLLEVSGKQVYVVVGALLKLGFNMKEVFALVLENPQTLLTECFKNFWLALHFLFEIGMEVENVARILPSHLNLLGSHSVRAPITAIHDFNGGKHSLCRAIKKDASMFSKLAFKPKRSRSGLDEKTQFLVSIGYLENSHEMAKALKRFRGRGDQLQERFDCLVKAGLDVETVEDMVKRVPTILNQNKDILEEKIECLKKYMGYPVESIVGFPSYLGYDIARIRARFSMYAWLREKGAAKLSLSVSTVVACSDARFVKYFVDVHPQGPAMWENIKQQELLLLS